MVTQSLGCPEASHRGCCGELREAAKYSCNRASIRAANTGPTPAKNAKGALAEHFTSLS